jgi:hypothetical protein
MDQSPDIRDTTPDIDIETLLKIRFQIGIRIFLWPQMSFATVVGTVTYYHISIVVTNNNGFWIGWLDLLTPDAFLYNLNHN